MSEELKIHVDLATQQAAKNAQQLAQALVPAKAEVKDLADSVDKLDKKTDAAADGMKGFAAGTNQAKTGVDALDASAKKAADSTEQLTDAATGAADAEKDLSKASAAAARDVKVVGDAAKESAAKTEVAASDIDRAGRKTKAALEESADAAGLLATGVDRAKAAFTGMIGATFGLAAISQIIGRMRENAEATVNALNQIGQRNLGIDRTLQDVVDNLGFGGSDVGRVRARNLATGFVQKTGTTYAQAAQIMSGAQGAGFSVADPNRPETDQKSAGFGIATEVGQFAARTRLDPGTAGELFKILAQEGATTPADARKILSQIEAAQNQTAIRNPAEFVDAFVRIAAGRQKGQLAETLGMFAAAAINDPSPQRAATKVEQFFRAAQGVPSKVGALGQMAAGAGLISEADIAAQMAPSDKAGDFSRREAELSRDESGAAVTFKDRQARLDASRKRLELERKEAKAKEESLAFRKLPAAERARRTEQTAFDLSEQQKTIDRETADLKRDQADSAARAREARANLAEDVAKDTDKRRAAAMGAAYQQLPASQREAFLRRMLAGKSDVERMAILNQITEGGELPAEVSKILGPAGMQAFDAASKAARAADPRVTAQRNQEYMRNNAIAQTERMDQSATAAGFGVAGAEYSSSLDTVVQKDFELLKATGMGGATTWSNWRDNSSGQWGVDKEQVMATRKGMIVAAQFQKLVRGLPPKTRAKLANEIKAMGDEIWNVVNLMRKGEITTGFGYGTTTLNETAAQLATKFGAFAQKVSMVASQEGESLPDFSSVPYGPNLPSLETLYTSPDPFGGVQSGPPSPAAPAATPAAVPGPQSALPASYGGSSFSQTIIIGTNVGNLPGNYDFPSRLEDA